VGLSVVASLVGVIWCDEGSCCIVATTGSTVINCSNTPLPVAANSSDDVKKLLFPLFILKFISELKESNNLNAVTGIGIRDKNDFVDLCKLSIL